MNIDGLMVVGFYFFAGLSFIIFAGTIEKGIEIYEKLKGRK